MKMIETVYFDVPASDVEQKDFVIMFKMIAIVATVLIITLLV